MEILLSISIALTAGLFISRFAKLFGLPAVTGYLIAGILIGPYCLGLLGVPGLGFTSGAEVKGLSMISDVALGFIAFAIGNEFRVSQLKKIGKQATVIALVQAIAATLLVDAALIGLHFLTNGWISLPAAIILGAIATATAPAATMMVVKQYKAKGKLTDLLLPIVALDDAIGLVVFAISFGIAKAMTVGSADIMSILVGPLVEVVASLVLGFIMGLLLTLVEKYFKSNSKRLSLTVTFVIMTVALSMLEFEIGGITIGFSSLLVCMMLGTIFCNLCDFSPELMEKTDKWTAPIYVLFFVLSGSELELSVFTQLSAVIIGIVFIITRSVGKITGASLSAKMMKCDSGVVKNLGITLLPQAGVALGMSAAAVSIGADGALVRNIVLFAVLIYELVGPYLTKQALIRSGDIIPKATTDKRSRKASLDDDDE